MKILTVVGARPQFIKAAAVSRALHAQGTAEVLVHTGQHYDDNMSAVFFSELEIREPDYNLGIGGGSHGVQTGRMLAALEDVMLRERPSWVVVYGDTNSTLAGALAAAKLQLALAHVEAGLRSYNRAMPEEINRVVADHLADVLFAPTATAASILRAEGIASERILQTGDVMYDAALHFARKAEAGSTILQRFGLGGHGYLLATIHRAENTDASERLSAIFDALQEVARGLPVVLPLHPRTRKALEQAGRARTGIPGLRLIEPVGYLDMTMLERGARLIVTDSGGVQKEAFFHGVPCVTVRTETEWTELVESGWNRLAPPTSAAAVLAALRGALAQDRPAEQPAFYGRGDAAERIARALVESPAGTGVR